MGMITMAAWIAFGVGLTVTWCLIVRTPLTWRQRRWALTYGDPDERRVGSSMWWSHVGRFAGTTTANIAVARWAVIDTTASPAPEAILIAVIGAAVYGIVLLIALFR